MTDEAAMIKKTQTSMINFSLRLCGENIMLIKDFKTLIISILKNING